MHQFDQIVFVGFKSKVFEDRIKNEYNFRMKTTTEMAVYHSKKMWRF